MERLPSARARAARSARDGVVLGVDGDGQPEPCRPRHALEERLVVGLLEVVDARVGT